MLFQELARVMDLKYDLQCGVWDSISRDLEQGSIDILTGVYYSKARAQKIAFSIPYETISYAIFVRTESKITSLNDLQSKAIIVVGGGHSEQFLRDQHLTTRLIPVDDALAALRLLAAGQHDGAIIPFSQGRYYLQTYQLTNIKAVGEKFLPRNLCIGVRQGQTELVNKLNTGIEILKSTGKYEELHSRYLDVYDERLISRAELQKIGLGFLFVFAMVVGVALVWTLILLRRIRTQKLVLEGEIQTRQATESALSEEKAHYELLFQKSPEGIVIVDKDGIIQRTNQEFLVLFGFDEKDILGKNIDTLITLPDDESRAREITHKAGTGGDVLLEAVRRKKDGIPIDVSILATAVQQADGTALIYAIYRDISQRKAASRAIEESRRLQNVLYSIAEVAGSDASLDDLFETIHQHLTELLDTSNFYISLFDRDKNFLSFPYWANSRDIPPPAGTPRQGLTSLVINTGQSQYLLQNDIRQLHKNGEIQLPKVIPELWLGVPMKVSGETVGVIAVQSYDDAARYSREDLQILEFIAGQIGESILHKRAVEALRDSEHKYRNLSEQLTEANNIKELLLDIITHDLKNAAGTIQGFAEILIENSPDDEILNLILTSSRRLLRTIEHATLLTQATVGDQIPTRKTDLSQLIADAVAEFEKPLTKAGIQVENKVTQPLEVPVNPIIREVFHNYISNALKYAAEGKRLIIEAVPQKQHSIRINFRDFGPTIPADKQALVFQRGTRLESGPRHGRGIGLAIVKRIAAAHNGSVGVEPNQPRGNTFFLVLPLA